MFAKKNKVNKDYMEEYMNGFKVQTVSDVWTVLRTTITLPRTNPMS